MSNEILIDIDCNHYNTVKIGCQKIIKQQNIEIVDRLNILKIILIGKSV